MQMLQVPEFLSAAQLEEANKLFDKVAEEDGGASAGRWARAQKRNSQLVPSGTQKFGAAIVRLLFENDTVAKRCYPKTAVHPTFNVYRTGDYYGEHEDNPIQNGIRADISYTLFVSDPHSYAGGELVVGRAEPQSFRCAAGTLLLYNAGLPHHVTPVREGVRRAAVGWLQSVVRDPERRDLMSRFYRALDQLASVSGVEHQSFGDLNAIRNQLMRMWGEL